MHYEARFVVDTHGHITTLYKPKGKPEGFWSGLPAAPDEGEVQPYDNSALCLYDMERYGIDMVLLKPSVVGTTNEKQMELVDKYPDKFRAFCCDQKLKIACARGEAKWTLQAAADEIEAALKTGKYIGIGEFVPRDWDRNKVYDFKERLAEYRIFFELARKYKVSIDFHDFTWPYEWDPWILLKRLAGEFPKVPIIICHGGHSIGHYALGDRNIRSALEVAGMAIGGGANVFLETGTWPAEYFKLALDDPNVGPTQLLWGGDYGHVPQYIVSRPGKEPSSFSSAMKRWPAIPGYQIDWWGWAIHQIHKVRDFISQDELNLIMGGNAARLWRLPVPYERMFVEGRPDIWGIHWQESMPFIPKEQVKNPDKEK